MQGTVLFQRSFIFDKFSKGIDTNAVFEWMDEAIKLSAFIDVELIDLSAMQNGDVRVKYIVRKTYGLNKKYAFRHLALQQINLN